MCNGGPTDESLMQATSRGDMAAFEQLVTRHQAGAWRIAMHYTGDAVEAEDLVQDAFLRILGAAARYRPTAAFQTYLYCVLARICIDFTRKKRPVPLEPLSQTVDPGLSASARMVRAERDGVIRAALDKLPPKYRMVIILRYFEGMSGQEMAVVMKTTPKSIERLLARARRCLEPALLPLSEEYGKSEGDSRRSSV